MGDEIDRAQAYDEFFRELALRNRGEARGTGNEDNLLSSNLEPQSSNLCCEDCGEPIPEARRRAIPGCRRCVACQTMHENWRPL